MSDKLRTLTQDFLSWDLLPDNVLTDGLTVEQVLKISTTTRWRLEHSGELSGHRFGASKRYLVGDIRALISKARA